jgi:hypothetical protein
MNVAVAARAVTVTVAGTVIAPLLLPRLTVTPPLGAAAFNVTVQTSVPEPVMASVLHVSPSSTGTPVPLRLTTAVGLVVELLVMVS